MTDDAIPQCRRCNGTGTFEWKPGHSGPCFLCNGTGDGRIQNYAGFGPRRGGRNWHGGKGGNGAATPAPSGNGAAMQDAGEAPAITMPPAVTGQHMTAAEHLAAALAGLQTSAPIDADTVRKILSDEFSAMGAVLAQTIDMARESHARLTAAIAGIPRRLVITVGDHMGELPAMRHPMVESLLVIVAQNIPAYIVGPAGSGKTTAAHQVATALGLPFYLQGAMTGTHEILGFVDAHGRYQSTPWRQAYEHGGVMLLDEIDASDAGALLAANAGISNGHMAFPDQTAPVARHADFRLIAAANTFGMGADRQYVGRTQLDGATLNRFAFLAWHYDETLERSMARNDDWTSFVQSVRRAVDTLKIRHIVSPRQSVMGATLLAAGMARETVESVVVWQGMAEGDIARVRGAL